MIKLVIHPKKQVIYRNINQGKVIYTIIIKINITEMMGYLRENGYICSL